MTTTKKIISLLIGIAFILCTGGAVIVLIFPFMTAPSLASFIECIFASLIPGLMCYAGISVFIQFVKDNF